MVFLTNASVGTPLRPFDDNDDRSPIEHGNIKATKQPWDLGHPPHLHDRAERVHAMCTLLMCTLASAYRLPCAREALRGTPVGWQRQLWSGRGTR